MDARSSLLKEASEDALVGKLIGELIKPVAGRIGTGLAQGARSLYRNVFVSGQYKNMFKQVVETDPLLKNYADKAGLEDAYRLMIKYSPTLAEDAPVTRAFLRNYVHGDGVINEQMIRLLSDAESSYRKATE
jgi:hypothetical protein